MDIKNSKQPMDSLEAMERLAEIMNNSSRKVRLGGTEWEIKALKPGTQWLIAEESVKIQKSESSNFSDVIKQFAINIPSVVRVITLALLNDKDKIYDKDEYQSVYDTVMWETQQEEWIPLLVEIMNMLSLDCFFDSTNAIAILREMALGRKKTMKEQKLSLAEQNGGK